MKVLTRHVSSFLKPRRGLPGLLVGSLLMLGGCTVGPKYSRPTAEVPGAYKELAPRGSAQPNGWKTAQPQDQVLRGKWWETLNDPELNALEERIDVSNLNL